MDPNNHAEQNKQPEEPRYLHFPCAPDSNGSDLPKLNKYSSTLTKDHDFPGAQVSIPDRFELIGVTKLL